MNTDPDATYGLTDTAAIDKTPIGGSLLVGFAASLCCGGGLIFGAIGLGALYGTLQMWRYIPEALAIGAILIAFLNWFYYRRKAIRGTECGSRCNLTGLRRTMILSAFLGLVVMAATFIFFEWLNHAVINADRFMSRPGYADAILPGVPNLHLLYVAMTFLVLPVVRFLPLNVRLSSSGKRT